MHYYHGSLEKIEIGTTLGQRAGYHDQWSAPDGISFYDVLEAYRPMEHIAHRDAVFMCDNIEDIDNAGGHLDYVYEMAVVGEISRHDQNWSSEIECLLEQHVNLTPEALRADLSAFPDLQGAARAYWSGRAYNGHDEAVWEYLARSAVVVELAEDNVQESSLRL